jgi:hypothetical protein
MLPPSKNVGAAVVAVIAVTVDVTFAFTTSILNFKTLLRGRCSRLKVPRQHILLIASNEAKTVETSREQVEPRKPQLRCNSRTV